MIPRYMGGAASIEALATGALEPVPDDDREEELLALDFPETPSEASGGARYDDFQDSLVSIPLIIFA